MITAAYVRGVFTTIDLRAYLGAPERQDFLFVRGGAPVPVTAAEAEQIVQYAEGRRLVFALTGTPDPPAAPPPLPDVATVVPGTAQPAKVRRPAATPESDSPVLAPDEERKE